MDLICSEHRECQVDGGEEAVSTRAYNSSSQVAGHREPSDLPLRVHAEGTHQVTIQTSPWAQAICSVGDPGEEIFGGGRSFHQANCSLGGD